MKKTLVYILLFSTLLVLIAACVPQAAPQAVEPTPDMNLIRTEVAATIQAQYTQEALSKPSVEPTIDATYTPWVITATFEPTSTSVVVIPSFTPVVSSSGGVAAPTKVPGPARLTSQSPYDGTKFKPGESFDGVFTIQNTGTKNWNMSYYIRNVSGSLVPVQTQVMIGKIVNIGEYITFTVDYVAPGTGGTHTSNWELVDDNGAVILRFYLTINVE
jgi:hypothetical protein